MREVINQRSLLTSAARLARAWLPIPCRAYMSAPDGATWRSGYATVCKTVYTSSILVVASIHIINDLDRLYERPQQAGRGSAGGVPALGKRNQRPSGPIVVGSARRAINSRVL